MDTAIQFDVYRTVGKAVVFGNAGYQFLGSSAEYAMEDGMFASLGLASQASEKTTVGGSVTWRQRTITGGDDAFELMAFAQHQFTPKSRLMLFAMHGFTDASPNLTLGATLGYTF